MNRRAWICLLPLALLVPAAARGAEGTVEEIRECVQANQPDSLAQTVTIRIVDAFDDARSRRLRVLWRREPGTAGSDTMIRIEAPPTLRRTAFLVVEEDGRRDMFMYLPEFDRVRRIQPETAVGSLFGSDFSYEDVEYVQQLSGDENVGGQRLADARVDGRDTWVVAVEPEADTSAYARVVTFVDQERCVPLEVRFLGPDEVPRKILRAREIRRQDGLWWARQMEMQDLEARTRTELQVEEIEVNPELGDSHFSARRLLQLP